MTYQFDKYFHRRSYYNCGDVRKEYALEFITLWPNWLGTEEANKLDEVTKKQWARFNRLIYLLRQNFELLVPNHLNRKFKPISELSIYLSGYRDSLEKQSRDFSDFVIPKLDCVISENWDYTYILYHKNNGALEAVSPIIRQAGLKHFRQNALRSKR